MEPYWTKSYKNGAEEHTVQLYRYSKNHMCVVSTHFFLNGFRDQFEKIQGTYNEKLKNIEKAGFLFHIDDQDKLIDLLQSIFQHKVKMTDNTEIISEIIELAGKLNKLILENKHKIYELSDAESSTRLSFKDEKDKNGLVIHYESSKGFINLFQT